ncbi:hypothetical protein CS369_08315 [Candidatus Symbiopectobacterium sp. 'North America']|uniref:hypothetical protein n=1 Tax=Candidatus Symbiopectobacterium sp. 'North America' TaxID=2794574 RepID=UPI0018CB78F2|nr:hypothetical protein [Candidatus Symbiopectobacterium sp. 'North America']MBG6244771.1 hypothetical protein [Candidatus Symbiopectobacterium sp. 'North America']
MSWIQNENGHWCFELRLDENLKEAYYRCLDTLNWPSPVDGLTVHISEAAWVCPLAFIAAAIAQALNDSEDPELPLSSLKLGMATPS